MPVLVNRMPKSGFGTWNSGKKIWTTGFALNMNKGGKELLKN
jgi:hypothetical protein